MINSQHSDHLKNTKIELDKVSDSFCVAKWKQVTMHLQNGMNHSCHHPKAHVVPIEEIKKNYKSLHNSEFKKYQRKLMLEGKRPNECDYCWRVEDTQSGSYSDRIYKSASQWALPFINEITKNDYDFDIDPSYVEVSFSNVCNFKCSYCAPHISSQWMEEIEKYGPYPTSSEYNTLKWIKRDNQMPIPNREENLYVDAFWKWFPEMYKNLIHFRITGGEPLLSKDTFKVLDYVIENPNNNLELSINTNLNPPDEIFDRFLQKLKIITSENKVKKVKLFTSAEAYGKQAEYIRHGLDYNKWLYNIQKTFHTVPNIGFTLMSTYNLLSIPSYELFLKDLLQIKKEFTKSSNSENVFLLDIPYLRYPEHQSVFIREPFMVDILSKQVEFMKTNINTNNNIGFHDYEIDKLLRIFNLIKNINENNKMDINRKDFVLFVDEHDKRRKTNFLETFPELNSTYNKWKTLL